VAQGLLPGLAAFLVSEHILAGKHLEATFSDPGVARAVIGGAMYLTVAGGLGLGIASTLRHTAAAIGTLIGVLLILPSLVGFLPGHWPTGSVVTCRATRAAPSSSSTQTSGTGPWTGLALFTGYALATLAVGAVMLRRRRCLTGQCAQQKWPGPLLGPGHFSTPPGR
jgi:ABC-2 type transport system permease protein